MVYEDADATLLRLFECFMESAPQLILQIYILIRDPNSIALDEESETDETRHMIKSSILVVSVVSSLFSLAWSLVVYHRSLRYTLPEKKNLHWKGSVLQFLWHFSSITARVIALSLFAALFPMWIGPACLAHWLIMSIWVIFQNTTACTTKVLSLFFYQFPNLSANIFYCGLQCEELLFCFVLGAIYIFSFFNAKEERTRWKYFIYYTFCFLENSALMLLWFLFAQEIIFDGNNQTTAWYFYPAIIGHYAAFFSGLAFMLIYYIYFHPSEIEVPLFLKWSKAKQRRDHQTYPKPEPDHEEEIELEQVQANSCASEVVQPVLDEADFSPSKKVTRTQSEPVPIVLTRTWKLMTGKLRHKSDF